MSERVRVAGGVIKEMAGVMKVVVLPHPSPLHSICLYNLISFRLSVISVCGGSVEGLSGMFLFRGAVMLGVCVWACSVVGYSFPVFKTRFIRSFFIVYNFFLLF